MSEDKAVEIVCSTGQVALVSACDVEYLSKYKWSIGEGYARRNYRNTSGQHTVFMHRDIMRPPEGLEVDHINGNRLDNRRSNLRLVTRQQNQRNRMPTEGTSKFKGVFLSKGKWSANIGINGFRRTISGLNSEEIAARIYDLLALDAFGEHARTNFDTFEQDRARIALAEAYRDHALSRYKALEDKLQASEARVRELEAELVRYRSFINGDV